MPFHARVVIVVMVVIIMGFSAEDLALETSKGEDRQVVDYSKMNNPLMFKKMPGERR